MRIRPIIAVVVLLLTACTNPKKEPANKQQDTLVTKVDTATFSEPIVKSLYNKSGLVARIKVLSAVKRQKVYVIDARVLEAYKGQADNQSDLEYEAFLKEGDYKEFLGKELIIFLTTNKQDKKLYSEGVRWGRTAPNGEFPFDEPLKSYILKLK